MEKYAIKNHKQAHHQPSQPLVNDSTRVLREVIRIT